MRPMIRRSLLPADVDTLTRLAAATRFFSDMEVSLVGELATDTMKNGESGHYRFIIAGPDSCPVGFTASGPVPCTASSWDLYWIVVAPEHQRAGLGRYLLELTESDIRRAGGSRIYVDTSGRQQYLPTRRFYTHCGYAQAALLTDFYAPGDDKLIYLKVL